MRIRTMPEIQDDGTRALVRALGYPDAVRFIMTMRNSRGDYTKERRKLLADLTLDDALGRAKAVIAEHAKKRPSRRRSA